MPWVALAAFALPEALRGRMPGAGERERATAFLWVWLVATLGFFSCAPSRLEHYALPALPAGALLAARAWQRASGGMLTRAAWRRVGAVGATMVVAAVAAVALLPPVLARHGWVADVPGLADHVLPAGLAVAGMGLLVLVATAHRHAACCSRFCLRRVVLSGAVLRAEGAPSRSSRGVRRRAHSRPCLRDDGVLRAPTEYQLVGGLAYYSGRRMALAGAAGLRAADVPRPEAATMSCRGRRSKRAGGRRRGRLVATRCSAAHGDGSCPDGSGARTLR